MSSGRLEHTLARAWLSIDRSIFPEFYQYCLVIKLGSYVFNACLIDGGEQAANLPRQIGQAGWLSGFR